jgi:hypothetical protein
MADESSDWRHQALDVWMGAGASSETKRNERFKTLAYLPHRKRKRQAEAKKKKYSSASRPHHPRLHFAALKIKILINIIYLYNTIKVIY